MLCYGNGIHHSRARLSPPQLAELVHASKTKVALCNACMAPCTVLAPGPGLLVDVHANAMDGPFFAPVLCGHNPNSGRAREGEGRGKVVMVLQKDPWSLTKLLLRPS